MIENKLENEIKKTLLDIHIDMEHINITDTLDKTKKTIEKLLEDTSLKIKNKKQIKEALFLCSKLWSPMYENILESFQDIQNLLIPKLEGVLNSNCKISLNQLLIDNNVKFIDFNNLEELPSLPITRDLYKNMEVELEKLLFDSDEDLGFIKKMEMEMENALELFDKDAYDNFESETPTIEYGPYCSSCQQAPCGCSDREQTSTTY